MLLENSPNVTYVDNEKLNEFLEKNQKKNNTATKLHENGIIEIDIKESLEYEELITKDMFDDYEKAGHLYPVTKSGLKFDEECQEIGSTRFCTNSKELANFLDKIIIESNAFPQNYEDLLYSGVSSYFRIMKYKKGGMHFPHYDSDYRYKSPNNDLITKYSLVMYLTTCETGEIAFIDDTTNHAKDKSDWTRQAKEKEVTVKIKPKLGKIVLFPHTLCHSVFEYKEDLLRVMIRGDLIFKGEKV